MFIDRGSDVQCFTDSCLFAIATPLQGLCCRSFQKQHILCFCVCIWGSVTLVAIQSSEITGNQFSKVNVHPTRVIKFPVSGSYVWRDIGRFLQRRFFSVNTINRRESLKTDFGRFLWPCSISKYLKIGTSFGAQLHPSSFCGLWRFKLPLSCFGQRHDVGSMPSPPAHTQTLKFADGANVEFQLGWLDLWWWSEGVRWIFYF